MSFSLGLGWLTLLLGENHLSFIETSALDASNVELAFQNILTGALEPRRHASRSIILTVVAVLQKSIASFPARRLTVVTAPSQT